MNNINNFKESLKFVAKWEWGNKKDGGYTNDPKDPGGETKFGISKRAHPNLDIANLTLEDAAQIYSKEYWDSTGCDGLEYPLCTVVFDTAINLGPGRATGFLRSTTDPYQYLALRRDHYVGIINKNTNLMRFAKGWWNRLADLKKLVDIALKEQTDGVQ